MENIEQVFQFNERNITIGEPQTSFLETPWDKTSVEFLKINSIRNLTMLWKYLHHLVNKAKESSTPGDPYSVMLLDSQTNSVASLGENP